MDNVVFNFYKKINEEINLKSLYPKKSLGNNIQKSWSNIDDKNYKSNEISKIIKKHITSSYNFDDLKFSTYFKELNNDGVTELNSLNLNQEEIDNILGSLKNKLLYPCHVPWQSPSKKIKFDALRNSNFGTYDLEVIFSFKKLIQILFNKNVIKIIEDYFECVPTLCSVNLYWNLPEKKSIGPKFFHRDVDDYKIVNVFCILSETEKNNGSYTHIIGTHTKPTLDKIIKNNNLEINSNDIFNLPMNGYGFENIYNNLFKDNMKTYYGKPGKILIADGFGLHKADQSITGRLMFWGTYSLTKTSCKVAQKPLQQKIPYENVKNYLDNNIVNKYIARHLIEF